MGEAIESTANVLSLGTLNAVQKKKQKEAEAKAATKKKNDEVGADISNVNKLSSLKSARGGLTNISKDFSNIALTPGGTGKVSNDTFQTLLGSIVARQETIKRKKSAPGRSQTILTDRSLLS